MLKGEGTAVSRAPGDCTVETERLIMAWYPETGLLVIQDRAGHGVTIAVDDLTPEARALLRCVVRWQRDIGRSGALDARGPRGWGESGDAGAHAVQ